MTVRVSERALREGDERLGLRGEARLFFIGKSEWPSDVRAHGGCLGTGRRGRTWQAAISCGEEHASVDPQMSEWGNPAGIILRHPEREANPGN